MTKNQSAWIRVMIFVLSAAAFYYVSRVVVFVFTWIYDIFQPIPEGVDMYREASRLAFEAIPDMSSGIGLSLIIALCIATLLTIFWKPYAKKSTSNIAVRKAAFLEENTITEPIEETSKRNVWEKNEDDWFDASLEDYDTENGVNVEFQEAEADLD